MLDLRFPEIALVLSQDCRLPRTVLRSDFCFPEFASDALVAHPLLSCNLIFKILALGLTERRLASRPAHRKIPSNPLANGLACQRRNSANISVDQLIGQQRSRLELGPDEIQRVVPNLLKSRSIAVNPWHCRPRRFLINL